MWTARDVWVVRVGYGYPDSSIREHSELYVQGTDRGTAMAAALDLARDRLNMQQVQLLDAVYFGMVWSKD